MISQGQAQILISKMQAQILISQDQAQKHVKPQRMNLLVEMKISMSKSWKSSRLERFALKSWTMVKQNVEFVILSVSDLCLTSMAAKTVVNSSTWLYLNLNTPSTRLDRE